MYVSSHYVSVFMSVYLICYIHSSLLTTLDMKYDIKIT